MKEKLENLKTEVLSFLKALPRRLILSPVLLLVGLVSLVKKMLGDRNFFLIVLFVGFVMGVTIGARVFDTGWAHNIFGVSLKGVTLKVSGPCKSGGELRKPGLAEDDVKVTFMDDKKLVGMLRATRETVECDLETTAYDVIPPFKHLLTTPVDIPEVKPFEIVQNDKELEDLKRVSRIRVRGKCSDKDGSTLPALDGEFIDVVSVSRLDGDKNNIKISGISKKTKQSISCLTGDIKYFPVDSNGDEVNPNLVTVAQAPVKKDLVGEIILITTTCFPDKRLPATKISKQVFYPLINARLQVTQNIFDEYNKLSYVAGAIIENGAMVECDSAKYPISWKSFDPNGTRLQTINSSATLDERASGVIEEQNK